MKKIALLTSLLALAACGGGSGGGSSVPAYIPSLSEELSGITAEQSQKAKQALGGAVAVSNADNLKERASAVYGTDLTLEQTLQHFENSITTLDPANIEDYKNSYEEANPESDYFESDEFKQMCELLNMDIDKYTSCINSSTNCDYVTDVLESDDNKLITQDFYSGDFHMIPKITDGGTGPTETYHLIADKNTGDIFMRTYISECPSGEECTSDSRGFIKGEDIKIANLNDFNNGVHSNGLTAFLNKADNIGLQYGDIFSSKNPEFESGGLLFFEPMYYDSKLVDMNALATSLTENVEYKGKAYGTIRIETAPTNPGYDVDAEVTGVKDLASINTNGDPVGVDATLTFNPNDGNPIETLNANFSAFNWYDTTITVQNGNITDVQLAQNGEITSGFAVDNGGLDTIEETEANSVYLGDNKNSPATEALGSYHIEWTRTEGSNNIDTLLDVAFGGVKQ